MPTPQQHLQSVVESIVSPVSTVISGAAATTTVTVWATNWRDTLHANAQAAIDASAYLAGVWFLVQIICKIYVTFFKSEPDKDVD